MSANLIEIQIAAAALREHIPKGAPLRARIEAAMRFVLAHGEEIFWLSPSVDDDLRFKTAVAAVMIAGDAEDREILDRSLKPLRYLSSMLSGVVVNTDAFADSITEDLIPLLLIWHDCKPKENA